MAKIKSKIGLINYIKMKMGAPLLNIELTDEQIGICIDDSINFYADFAYGGTEEGHLLLELEDNKLEYTLPDNVIAITDISSSSNNSVFQQIPRGMSVAIPTPLNATNLSQTANIDIKSMIESLSKISMIQSLFNIKINYSFNFNNKLLKLHEKPRNSTILLELGLEYTPNEDNDQIYNNHIVKQRALGESYVAWSYLMGKYSSQLINGSTINYDDMRQRGQDLIQESTELLWDNQDPLGMYCF